MAVLRTISYIFLACASLLFLSGCANTRFLRDGEVLFKANKILYTKEEPESKAKSLSTDLKEISQLQPNKKFLGVAQTRLWFYNVAGRHKQNKFRFWMKEKIGEAPVLYDSTYATKSAVLMENYLVNNGYFYAKVDYKTAIKRKKATVVYLVDLGDVYRINNIKFPAPTNPINKIIQDYKKETVLVPCEPFKVSVLKDERERIAKDLQNEGYFYLSREYVTFDLDSNNSTKLVNVSLKINPPSDSTQHQIYYINNVFVHTDYSIEQFKSEVELDTFSVNEYHFVYEDLKYRTNILIGAIHFERDKKYSRTDYNATLNHLADLGVFRFINIKFVPSLSTDSTGRKYLDCIITLTPSKKQEWGVEASANNNTTFLLGISGTFTYRNKNVFKGAELLEISVTTGFETNFDKGRNFFNTVDIRSSANLYFNKFMVPFKLIKLDKSTRPKTIISVRNSFLRRVNYYTVSTTNLSFGYDWRQSDRIRHRFDPISISLVRVLNQSAEFSEILNRSQTLRTSFSEQLIIGMYYNITWSSKYDKYKPTQWFFLGNIETAGNFIHGIYSLVYINKNEEKPYSMFNVPYAQYLRLDGDMRNYTNLGRKASLVSRLFGGIGVPYGNTESLPYIKQYFSGGNNGIRAWRVRALGPGSFVLEGSDLEISNPNIFFDQTGDIKIEANLELRFDIYKFIKGAVFLDGGNIWTLKGDTLRPGANFEFNRFYKEFALGTGVGFRFDFSYFVLRFDVGMPLHDPGSPERNNWVIKNFAILDKDWRKNNLIFNLAIGYPF